VDQIGPHLLPPAQNTRSCFLQPHLLPFIHHATAEFGLQLAPRFLLFHPSLLKSYTSVHSFTNIPALTDDLEVALPSFSSAISAFSLLFTPPNKHSFAFSTAELSPEFRATPDSCGWCSIRGSHPNRGRHRVPSSPFASLPRHSSHRRLSPDRRVRQETRRHLGSDRHAILLSYPTIAFEHKTSSYP
jgi:hypothetical protein